MPLSPFRILLLPWAPSDERSLMDYVGVFVRTRRAEVRTLYASVLRTAQAPFDPGSLDFVVQSWPFDMLMTTWPSDAVRLRDLAGHLAQINGGLLVVPSIPVSAVRRIVVAGEGGGDTLEQLGVAHEMGRAWNVPVYVVGGAVPPWRNPLEKDAAEHQRQQFRAMIEMQAALLQASVSVGFAGADNGGESPPGGYQEGDLVVPGAAPGLVPREDGRACMFVRPRKPANTLATLIPETAIGMGLKAGDRREAVTRLVDRLADHGLISPGLQGDVLRAALRREGLTGPDVWLCRVPESAIKRSVGCLGLFPEGVPFAEPAGERARFAFLFLDRKEDPDERIAVSSRIARCLHRRETRDMLLQCSQPGDVAAFFADN